MCIFFFSFPVGFIVWSSFTECQIFLKLWKTHWKKCNLEFRKRGIKDCEWSKIPEKCGIKECEWWLWFKKCEIKQYEFWTKFTFFNSAFFCSAGRFYALISSLKVLTKNNSKQTEWTSWFSQNNMKFGDKYINKNWITYVRTTETNPKFEILRFHEAIHLFFLFSWVWQSLIRHQVKATISKTNVCAHQGVRNVIFRIILRTH